MISIDKVKYVLILPSVRTAGFYKEPVAPPAGKRADKIG